MAKRDKKKRGILKEHFANAVNYVVESRNYIYIIAGIFVLSAIIGFVFSENFSFFDEILRGIVEKTQDMRGFELITFIFLNNLQSAFFGMIFGIFFGIFPILGCILNGSVLGYVINRVWLDSGTKELWRILPHGVFELPAIFISLALGLRIGMFIFSKNKMKELKHRIYNSVIVFAMIVLPLLVIAAIIEGILIILLK